MKSKACFFAKKTHEALQRESKEKIGAALNFGDLSNAALEQLQIYVNDVGIEGDRKTRVFEYLNLFRSFDRC